MTDKSWFKKFAGLKRLIEQVGSLWPAPSTKIAGYAEDGPYHCEDCVYLKGKTKNEIFRDEDGKGRCGHPMMIKDPEVKKDKNLFPIVNIEKGCCEFVDPPKSES